MLVDSVSEESSTTVYLVQITTNNTLPETATNYIKPTMKLYEWKKASGEGDYQGLRGLYVKVFEHSSLVEVEEDFKKVIGVLRGGIVKYAKFKKKDDEEELEADKVAAVHAILVKGVLYNERRMNMLKLPFVEEL